LKLIVGVWNFLIKENVKEDNEKLVLHAQKQTSTRIDDLK
jgi:hypothetical protein